MQPDILSYYNRGDPAARARLLEAVRAMEAEPAMLGVSAHLSPVAMKQ